MTINPNRKEKKCSICSITKPRSDFYSDRSRVDGISSYCKPCTSKRNKKWRDENPRPVAESALWTRRKIFYGITKEQFYEMMENQNHQCKICKIEIDKSAHVDHCHETGKVRGILCLHCNKGLGFFKDNINSLSQAIQYLKYS